MRRQNRTAPRAFTLFSVLLAVLMLSSAAAAETTSSAAGRFLAVRGHAEENFDADRAEVTLEIRKVAAKLELARSQVTEVVERVLALTKELGIPAGDVQASGVEYWPDMDRGWFGTSKPKEYTYTRTVQVRVDDLAKLGPLVERSVDAGVTDVGTPRMNLKNEAELRRQVLGKAVDSARKDADAMAAAGGVRVKGVRSIAPPGYATRLLARNENYQGVPEALMEVRVNRGASKSSADAAVTYTVAEVHIAADVEVEFDLE